MNVKEETKEASTYLCIYLFLVIGISISMVNFFRLLFTCTSNHKCVFFCPWIGYIVQKLKKKASPHLCSKISSIFYLYN